MHGTRKVRSPIRSPRGPGFAAVVCVVLGGLLMHEATAAPPRPQTAKPWTGPAGDFQRQEGRIVGPWWQGGSLGVVYFTGPYAQKLDAFESVGQAIAETLGRPYREIHKDDLLPSDGDSNGILVYPDGTARVELFLMPGGNGHKTMKDIAGVTDSQTQLNRFVEHRRTPQAAFKTGMNYLGCCGGFFVATSGYLIPDTLSTGWELWPGKVQNIGPGGRQPFPDVVFDAAQRKHPLFRATNEGVLKNMFYSGGPIGVQSDVPDTEYFGKYVGGAMPELVGDWFCIAYRPKDNGRSGRCVIATGHPEVNHKDFLLAMAQYAVYHDYEVPRNMIESGKPIEAVAGDQQMQYYCLPVEQGKKLTVTLTGMTENCDLYVRHDLPPTFRKSDAKSTRGKTADETVIIAKTKAGDYFLGVHGQHAVLNGASYTLTATVE